MRSFQVHYVGDLTPPLPETAIEVDDDLSYVQACRAVRTAMWKKTGLELWIHTPHHAAWLKEYLRQIRIDADFTEESARTVLAEKWAVTIPEWVTDQDILGQNLFEIDVSVSVGSSFEAMLTSSLLQVNLNNDVPNEQAWAELFSALIDETYNSVKGQFPILENAIIHLAETWQTKAKEEWLVDFCDYIPQNLEMLHRVISASAILRSYPRELLERVLPPGQVSLACKIPPTLSENIALDSGIREEALTQVRLLFADVSSKTISRDEFRKIVGWVSGKTGEELRLLENLLRRGNFNPEEEDIRIIRERFEGCADVRRSRLAALEHLVRPTYPAMPEDVETGMGWIRWAVEQYSPYRTWQVQNSTYDPNLEEMVCSFSDWYVTNYARIQADTETALIHALNTLNDAVHRNQLTAILMIDCLPIDFFDSMDQALRSTGFKQHNLEYRLAALPTVTGYNKAAVISGRPGPAEKPYQNLLGERSEQDWRGVPVRYISSIRELSEFDPGGESSVVFINHVEGDEILHSDVEAKNRTYEEELSRSYSQLSEALAEMCERWPGDREKVSVIVLSDHGACRLLEEEGRSFESKVVSKLFDNEKHRVATMTENQAAKVPENLWDIGYRFTSPLSHDNGVHFLPRGHNTVRKTGRSTGYMHGGITPEEVIVPVAHYGLVSVAWKRPFTRFLNLELSSEGKTAQFYIQRVVKVEIELQNPNTIVLQPKALELLAPDAVVKAVELHDVGPESLSIFSIHLYFQKAALEESSLELALRYTLAGEEYEQMLVHPAEFKSAMSGGFSLKDL